MNVSAISSSPAFSWKHLVTVSADTITGRIGLDIDEGVFKSASRVSSVVRFILRYGFLSAMTLAISPITHVFDILWSTVLFSVSLLPIKLGPSSHHLKNIISSVVLVVTIPFRIIAYFWTQNGRILCPIDFNRRPNGTPHVYIEKGQKWSTDEAWLQSLIQSHPPDRSTLSREENFIMDLLQCPGGCNLVRRDYYIGAQADWVQQIASSAARGLDLKVLRLCLSYQPELAHRNLSIFSWQSIDLLGRVALMPRGAEFLTDQIFTRGEWGLEYLEPGWYAKIALWATEQRNADLIQDCARLRGLNSLCFNGVNPLSLCIDKIANPELSQEVRNSFKETGRIWRDGGLSHADLGNQLTPFLKGLYKLTGPDYLPPQIKRELEFFLVNMFPMNFGVDWLNRPVKNAQGDNETLLAYAAKRGLFDFVRSLTLHYSVPPTPRNMTPPLTAAILSPKETPFRETIVSKLLEKGADPNISFPNGHTPLTHAVAFQDYELAKMLLRRGARPDAPCDHPQWFRKTPTQIAQDTGDAKMQEMLRQAGASHPPQTPPRQKLEEKLIHPELLQMQLQHLSPLLSLFVALKRASLDHQFWKIFGANAPMTKQQLDSAFRKAAKGAHPDKASNGDKAVAQEMTKALNAVRAYLEARVAPATP